MPSPQHLHFTATVNAPREKVFAFFADHEKFVTLFGAKCRRSRDGEGEVNGLGSVRTAGSGFMAFDETIVRFDKPSRIDYQITRGSPLKNHKGEIRFSEIGPMTQVDYQIQFEGKFPFIAWLVARMLRKAWAAQAGKVLADIS